MKLKNNQLPSSQRRVSWLITTPIRDCVRWAQARPFLAAIIVVTMAMEAWIIVSAMQKPAVNIWDVVPAVFVLGISGMIMGLIAYCRKRWSP